MNHVLIQLYRSGKDCISEHSDKTIDVVPGSSIVNVSFGARRTMTLRKKKDRTPAAADALHPAFSNLFVQTELLPERRAILCTRRPRSHDERPPWMFHLMVVRGEQASAPSFETDRLRFIGPGHDQKLPT